ncbi:MULTISPECIES: hypothetical protein [Kingella]|uniref:Uncharacterized protein n=3 Tax=Kingella TaxID=32257 RepID=A0A238TEA5_9NEIS|nr:MULTISPECIES: hypothetical protein [Kingella]EGK12364.1 hypothetical protein HMPREF0476_0059 [Kingella kingae ATCC 23330]MDK4534555.1 hypothetical protein [Kingella kingae]MDK4536456.1 hypothetical protein [Kingella kingae]MDK4537923.1 hypothetical protein [Kingella kingae]MDK4541070.1 hypothetical protein [Kingella kingae]
MANKYLANTPLILQNENGEDVRVERGETVVLSDTQYAEVAAHVTLIETTEKQPETAEPKDNQPAQSAPEVTQPEKPKRNSKAEQ